MRRAVGTLTRFRRRTDRGAPSSAPARRKSFRHFNRPLEPLRFDGEEERSRILRHVGDVLPRALTIDDNQQRTAADIAVQDDAKGAWRRRAGSASFPGESKHAGCADEGIGLLVRAAGPVAARLPDGELFDTLRLRPAGRENTYQQNYKAQSVQVSAFSFAVCPVAGCPPAQPEAATV